MSPPDLTAPLDSVRDLENKGHRVETFQNLEDGVNHVDILYVTRTQEERFPSQEEADRYRGLFRINQTIYTEHCEPNTVIMHPLPGTLGRPPRSSMTTSTLTQTLPSFGRPIMAF
ncbi:MAG: hypothetical protein CM1200mP9_03500 [Gammaproteobacteria bacterium]|nr:MAG: hypothetical protein CM1200mP9_03500 [Gammaproteobacteria bacterium]